MDKIILAINVGSSSIKVSVYSVGRGQAPTQIAEAQISGLTAPPAKLTYSRGGNKVTRDEEVTAKIDDQGDAFRLILGTLEDDSSLTQVGSRSDISLICHRVVHGGDFARPERIHSDSLHKLEALNDLAPLHNAPALGIVETCVDELSGAINVACFDSQFHSTLPLHVRTYPIDQKVAEKNHLRKYGFHGISYSFVTRSVADFLGKRTDEVNLIALHLGSGASACAIKAGESWDTSMGLTPLAGLPGATRSGSVDPSLVFHYASDVGRLSPTSTKDLHISRAEEILNKESGWKALTGTTDFGAIAGSDDPDKRLAFDLVVDRISGFVGSYYCSLRGEVDALVFAGGIGEKGVGLRKAVLTSVACLGFELDEEANARDVQHVVQEVGRKDAKHRVLVCRTDEQMEMATSCANMSELWNE